MDFTNKVREVADTIDGVNIVSKRKAGNTTRQVDHAIQKLFEGKIVWCVDHYQRHRSAVAHVFLLDKIIERMGIDHGNLQEKGYLKINIIDKTLMLTDEYFAEDDKERRLPGFPGGFFFE